MSCTNLFPVENEVIDPKVRKNKLRNLVKDSDIVTKDEVDVIDLISRMGHINAVSFAGDDSWFDINGIFCHNYKPKLAYKYSIEYDYYDRNNEERTFVFN